ncbi:helix-turn-helix transcriptional regulator [Staphylococcus agnetis]|uniref:helix-turn-helix transcriptional regulator n=1 Tax=Staphylococcus agnetis TaxID=985762 RepID=UPI0015740618|nr:helix-turn-helix domain-containing protein [Staphylococcus agnetis]
MNKVLGYRKMLNKTQAQMAKKLNISEQAYRNKEKGKTEFKKDEMIVFKNILISNGLKNVTLEDIFLVENRRKTTYKEVRINENSLSSIVYHTKGTWAYSKICC